MEPPEHIDALARRAIGAAIEVHKVLGPGFAEGVYEEALAVELELRGIPFRRQEPVDVAYKGRTVGRSRVDLLVDDELIVELKSVEALAPVHTSQLISYLAALNKPLGLLLNFNVPLLKKGGIKRVVWTPPSA